MSSASFKRVPLGYSRLKKILQQETEKLHVGSDREYLTQLLLELMEGVVAAGYGSYSDGRKRLEAFVLIDRLYYTVESKCGIAISLDTLIGHIQDLHDDSADYWKESLAIGFDGRFTSRIPWDSIWADSLLRTEGVNRSQITSYNTCEVAAEISKSEQSVCSVLSLPAEIIRHILHLGAESFLPAMRSSYGERQILHLRRSHYLSHAALTHSKFRREAQLELISIAFAKNVATLNKLLNFVEHNNLLLNSLKLDDLERQGELYETYGWARSLAKLSRLQGLSGLTFLDLGGKFSSTVIDSFKNGEIIAISQTWNCWNLMHCLT